MKNIEKFLTEKNLPMIDSLLHDCNCNYCPCNEFCNPSNMALSCGETFIKWAIMEAEEDNDKT